MKTISKFKFKIAMIIIAILAFVFGLTISYGLITNFWKTLIILGISFFLLISFWAAYIIGTYYEQKKHLKNN